MPFARPGLNDLVDQAVSEIKASLPGADPQKRRSVLGALARVVAGHAHGLHGYANFISRQILPDSAEDEFLVRHATLRGLIRLAPIAATGTILVTGSNGTIIPEGNEWVRSDNQSYITLKAATITAGTIEIPVQAVNPGDIGNCDPDTPLTSRTTLLGFVTKAVVSKEGIVGGRDLESDDSLRSRLLDIWRAPPLGGAIQDYQNWVQEVVGSTKVWVFPLRDGPGSVYVTFVNADGTIPSEKTIMDVQRYINDRRPVTARVQVYQLTEAPINPTIHLIPDTAEIREAVQIELQDLLFREAAPNGRILISHFREAVSNASGVYDYIISNPLDNFAVDALHLPTLGKIDWN